MNDMQIIEIQKYIGENISRFHNSKIESLKKLKLCSILKRKNPYLFRAKNILTANDLIKTLLDAHLSSQEETIFGDFLEGLAIFVCNKVYDGRKSSAEGIDLEFKKGNVLYIISIKSGPNWGNSSQILKMRDNFNKARRILRTNNSRINVVAVNGCCYGKERMKDKGDYFKYCGQEFWKFISGNSDLYLDIIEPLGFEAKKRNDEFIQAYSQIINIFTSEFYSSFCVKGKINWDKLVKFNSGKIQEKISF